MHYPPSEWERIMKIQDVFTRAEKRTLTWREAAEILRVDERTVRRWRETVEEDGYSALLDRRTQRPSPKRAPHSICDKVKKLYREKYWEWNVKHFHEQLVPYGIDYKYTWTKNLLQEAGLVEKRRLRDRHRKRRLRKPLVGMMLHIDGSEHAWIPALLPQRQDLVVVMDDATSEVYYAKLVNEEDTRECMLALWHVVKTKGVFCSIYSDRASHFFHTTKAGGRVDLKSLTQIGRALYELGIEMIPAYSPEARGRSERLFETWQGRLPKELSLHKIKTIPDANRYILESFLPWYKDALVKEAEQKGSAFTPCRRRDLDFVFSIKEQRQVGSDNTFQWNNKIFQIEPSRLRISFAKCTVTLHQHLDETLSVLYGPHLIGRFNLKGGALQTQKPKMKLETFALTT